MSAPTLPEKRADGLCVDCTEKPAVTNDGRFCKPCLRARLKAEAPPDHRSAWWMGKNRGRRDGRGSGVIGGAPREMTEDGDDQ